MLLDICNDKLEGCGKASIVGMGGEIEHAQAMTHTLHFGNQFREAINAKSYLVFTNTRGAAGTSLMIPLMHKDDGGLRSHYQTIHTTVPDAPADDEILIALGASIGGHPLHRIGNRYEDLKDMGRDVENPADVSYDRRHCLFIAWPQRYTALGFDPWARPFATALDAIHSRAIQEFSGHKL